jgi:hypothetical protein
MPDAEQEKVTLPCGCQFWSDTVTQTLIYEPCSIDCKWYKYSMAEAEKRGKDVTHLDTR